MSKCIDCKYCHPYKGGIGTCKLTRYVVKADKDHDCSCFNRNICNRCGQAIDCEVEA